MVKKELLQMRPLKATPKMLQLAEADTPKAEVIRCTDTYSYERVRRQYRLFARCVVENGILKGKGNDTLDPTANVTRAEVAVMLDRFIALLK